ncbi:hypothetical protein FHX79_115487 [Streptomyces cavourensis]|uniref:hypothetical protein n=1 Tax=Streptomyces cavourensis TaxID=67258 RepID=UPI001152B9E1|nr:hypothetical protein [Streptomyces cavourensis]TQO33591.1 hypothetical protein FHX79_115487 [Streptomyces cavourensis]GGU88047.1 hypothetical protein GCM10010498_53250 [Streptomyces cavourensis]
MKKVPRSQRKTLVVPKRVPAKGNNGLKHRRDKRRAEADAPAAPPQASRRLPADSPRTYRPEELLSPHMLLARFTERATELLTAVPEEERPTQTAVAAALRQAVLEAFRSREEYVARMVEVDLLAGAPKQNATSLRKGIRAALLDQGVRCVDAPDGEHELFVVVEGDGEAFEVLRPAYVDQATGKLVLAGQLRRLPGAGGADHSAGGDDAANGEGV